MLDAAAVQICKMVVMASTGVIMEQRSQGRSLHVDLHDTLSLLCQGTVAAFQSTQLSSGNSAQSTAALLAAVATASSTKAAEVQRLMAESQKVLLSFENAHKLAFQDGRLRCICYFVIIAIIELCPLCSGVMITLMLLMISWPSSLTLPF